MSDLDDKSVQPMTNQELRYGEALRATRIKMGMGLKKTAAMIGVTDVQLSQIERGVYWAVD